MSKTRRESEQWRKKHRKGKLDKVPVWRGIDALRSQRAAGRAAGRKAGTHQ